MGERLVIQHVGDRSRAIRPKASANGSCGHQAFRIALRAFEAEDGGSRGGARAATGGGPVMARVDVLARVCRGCGEGCGYRANLKARQPLAEGGEGSHAGARA
jgi:hypothetical protein